MFEFGYGHTVKIICLIIVKHTMNNFPNLKQTIENNFVCNFFFLNLDIYLFDVL